MIWEYSHTKCIYEEGNELKDWDWNNITNARIYVKLV